MYATALLLLLTAQSAGQGAATNASQSASSGSPIVVTGCLTSANVSGRDQFTLTTTDTNRAAGNVKTETYQLLPKSGIDLKSMVGHRVEVTGTSVTTGAETTTVDSTRTTEKPAGTSGKTPTVETKTHADMVVHQMNVTSAKPVAGDCRVP